MAQADYENAKTNYETAVAIMAAMKCLHQDLIHCFMGADVQSEYLMVRVQDLQHNVAMLENLITYNESLKNKMILTIFSRPPDTGPERKVDIGTTKKPH